MKRFLIFILIAGVFFPSEAQIPRSLSDMAHLLDSIRQDTTRRDTIARETPASVPAGNTQESAPARYYRSVIKPNAITREGLFTVHKVGDKYFFEIPDSLLGRDLLVVCRIAQGAAGLRSGNTGYAGDHVGTTVIRFEKGPDHKLFLRRISYADQSGDSTTAMFNAVLRSNLQPLAAAFGINTYSINGKGSVVEVTDYVNGDNDILFFNDGAKQNIKVGRLLTNMCYIKDISAFPRNLEVRTIKTYSYSGRSASQSTSPNVDEVTSSSFTLELNTSILLLPKQPMRKRMADRRVGYFTERYTDYNTNPQGVEVVSYIKRWRLEPKPEDVEKYLAGELVEPQKPIIFYIDPATPSKWVPYLIRGVMDWQVAFEAAGFKNAIIAKEAPTVEENPSWRLEDSRHSAIVYKPSPFANATGPVITDPRSGEILESHINWYHNLMSILRLWYFVQCSPTDPRAQKMRFDDDLMGELIRSVACHEVGHALGLTHNFGASATVPVELLRNKKWVEHYGHTPSIMDYARFNYVAQPEDSISAIGLISRIGQYDIWAIEWGYRWFPDDQSQLQEVAKLNQWTIEKLKDERLWFGSEFSSDDPRVQTEDLGNNAMYASAYGIKNLKRIIPNLIEWTREENEGYKGLLEAYNGVSSQFDYYLGHVVSYIGGVHETYKTVEQPGPVYEVVPVKLQRNAMDFLDRYLFQTPHWLLDTTVLRRIGQPPLRIIGKSQEKVLSRLLSLSTLDNLINNEALFGKGAYALTDFFKDLDAMMWTELEDYGPVDIYRRNLQRIYVEKLLETVNPDRLGRDLGDVIPILQAKLDEIKAKLKKASAKTEDTLTKYHLNYLYERIDES